MTSPANGSTTLGHDDDTGGPSVRLLVVDDHPAVRVGLCELLDDQPDFVVTGAASSAEEALALASDATVDVAIVDYHLGRLNGLWLSQKLKRRADPPAVVIYSAYCDGLLTAASVIAEAAALISKRAPPDELFAAIRASARGGTARLPPLPATTVETVRHRLSTGEQTIFGMLLAGFDRPAIADRLGLPAAELESQLHRMLAVFDAETQSATALPGPVAAPDQAGP